MTCFTASKAASCDTAATQSDLLPSGAVTSTRGIPVRTFAIFGICAAARPFPATQTDVSESPASLPAIGSGSRSALTQPMGAICAHSLTALQWHAPELTRRRNPDARDECWHIYFGDVPVGAAIALRTGMPPAEDPWGWSCGFYPGSPPRECTDGTAATFNQARADFEAAWRVFLSHRTEADFQGGPGATERNPVDARYP